MHVGALGSHLELPPFELGVIEHHCRLDRLRLGKLDIRKPLRVAEAVAYDRDAVHRATARKVLLKLLGRGRVVNLAHVDGARVRLVGCAVLATALATRLIALQRVLHLLLDLPQLLRLLLHLLDLALHSFELLRAAQPHTEHRQAKHSSGARARALLTASAEHESSKGLDRTPRRAPHRLLRHHRAPPAIPPRRPSRYAAGRARLSWYCRAVPLAVCARSHDNGGKSGSFCARRGAKHSFTGKVFIMNSEAITLTHKPLTTP